MRSSQVRPYLSGLARRPVKKQSRPRASRKRRKLRAAARTTFRVGTRKAILRGRARSALHTLPLVSDAGSRALVSGTDLALSPG